MGSEERADAEAFAGAPYALISGVGDPAQVAATVSRYMGHPPARVVTFSDHYAYGPAEAAKLEALGLPVICTAKDAVKLRALGLSRVWSLRVEAAFGPSLWTDVAFPVWFERWAVAHGLISG